VIVPRPISITRPRHVNRPIVVDAQAKPAAPSDGLALVDDEFDGQRLVHREQPSAQIRAGRSRTRILDDGAVLREKEAGKHPIAFAREDIGHCALAVAAVMQ
jgi:hypothetical protein